MQKEPNVFAPNGTPQLPLCTAALCNNVFQSFRNEGHNNAINSFPAYCLKCLAHSAFMLQVTPSSFHFCASMRKPFQHDDQMKAKVCLWVPVWRTYFRVVGIKLAYSRIEK
jgi:hypothetical protein